MTLEFKATDEAAKRLEPVGQTILEFAFQQAEEFIDLGQSPREAASIVANMMLRAAWVVAGSGAVAENLTPDPEKFRACVEKVLETVAWERDEVSE